MRCRTQIKIKGIVQGVGFRPFIYKLARKYNLLGYVLNNTSGVLIDVEGEIASIDAFIENVKTKPPPQAVIFELKSNNMELLGYEDFVIKVSEAQEEKFVPISPDIATCDECLQELFNPSDRRYRYPFINCTNCGPRFTIVKDIPYDRKFTTMKPFIMCDKCQGEYDDPGDRRFHAQPNACPVCGPGLFLLNGNGNKIDVPDVINEVCRLLKEGEIIAIKGLGGYHLACDAQNQDAVSKLRSRKYREHKPFALMVKDIDTAKRLCYVGEEEERLLKGTIRPIVLLKRRPDCPVSKDVAPSQKYHGIMLPYTPMHHLIVRESGLVLVMTSGNISCEPIAYLDEEALESLKSIADYFVFHNRNIHIRTDDSVNRVWRGKEILLRRARGYAPFPLLLPFKFEEQILACGADLKNTFCMTRENYVFVSQHIGDLENLETLTSFEQGIDHFKRIFNIDPAFAAYDFHPEYLSTRYALSLAGTKKIGVQHHHAHIVSCMVDNGIDGRVIGVSFDGTGYGMDGKIWGGEFLVCDYGSFERAGNLEYMPLPGGEKAIIEPWRIAGSLLYNIYGEGMYDLDMDFIKNLDLNRWKSIKKMLDNRLNAPMTSSVGRLFDAVSALTGLRKKVHYEGQAAIELEMAAGGGKAGSYLYDLNDAGNTTLIMIEPVIRGVVSDIINGKSVAAISSKFHNTIADIILNICLIIRKRNRLDRVCLSGGVFQNIFLLERAFVLLNKNGFKIYTHHRVPPNDGGIALGQAIIANELIKDGSV